MGSVSSVICKHIYRAVYSELTSEFNLATSDTQAVLKLFTLYSKMLCDQFKKDDTHETKSDIRKKNAKCS